MRDDGASPVIGNLLMVAVTVLMGASLVIIVAPQLKAEPELAAQLVVEAAGDRLSVVHHGGDTLPGGSTTLFVTVDGLRTAVALTSFSATIGTGWDPGERACFTGPYLACEPMSPSYTGKTLTDLGVVSVTPNTGTARLMVEWSGVVTGG